MSVFGAVLGQDALRMHLYDFAGLNEVQTGVHGLTCKPFAKAFVAMRVMVPVQLRCGQLLNKVNGRWATQR